MKTLVRQISLMVLLVIGTVAIIMQWGWIPTIATLVIISALAVVMSYFEDPKRTIDAPMDESLRNIRIAEAANIGLVIVFAVYVIASIATAGIAGGLWPALALAAAWTVLVVIICSSPTD